MQPSMHAVRGLPKIKRYTLLVPLPKVGFTVPGPIAFGEANRFAVLGMVRVGEAFAIVG